jgi:hypothetical protein
MTTNEIWTWLWMNRAIISLVAGLLTLTTFVWRRFQWIVTTCRRIWEWATGHRPRVPRHTIRVVGDTPWGQGARWFEGTVGNQPAMQVVGNYWHITNISDGLVHVLAVHLKRPRMTGAIQLTPAGGIPRGATVEASFMFWVQPPIRKAGSDLKATIIFVDQFGNEHAVKTVFAGPQPIPPQSIGPPPEPAFRIVDPVERTVVEVLKDELVRYANCGRRIGGFGSITLTYQGRNLPGLGADWREQGSPQQQSIIQDPETAQIVSDNAEALLRRHEVLSVDEKQRFADALLRRLSRQTEYAPIGYFIVFVLIQIGALASALRHAMANLRGDQNLGFSEVMRLLDGLLRVAHPSFSLSMLDDTEEIIQGMSEDTFQIRERIAAIRAYRIRR